MSETAPVIQHPDRNLGMELVRATEAAAIRAVPWIGRGDKNGADGAAVNAMRKFLSTVSVNGTIVIGEGEKDEAPMLFNGEQIGNGLGPECDVAVDPIDGTSLTATGRPNALSLLAVADRGSMFDPVDAFYMDKLVGGPEAKGVVSLEQSVGDNIRELAKAKQKDVADIVVALLDRPRHDELIDQIRSAGAGTRLMRDGDVAGGINAARWESRIDLCMGTGGTPEGVITACAIKALGGVVFGRLNPQSDEEREKVIAAGHDLERVLSIDDLVTSDNTYFVATGVTDGQLLDGVRRKGPYIRTESLVLRAKTGTARRVVAEHLASKWLDADAAKSH